LGCGKFAAANCSIILRIPEPYFSISPKLLQKSAYV